MPFPTGCTEKIGDLVINPDQMDFFFRADLEHEILQPDPIPHCGRVDAHLGPVMALQVIEDGIASRVIIWQGVYVDWQAPGIFLTGGHLRHVSSVSGRA